MTIKEKIEQNEKEERDKIKKKMVKLMIEKINKELKWWMEKKEGVELEFANIKESALSDIINFYFILSS